MTKKHASTSISQQSYIALLWNYLGSVVRMSSQFLIGIVLARLLGPEAFGIVAIGFFMVGIGNLVADFGMSSALIQCKTLDEKDIRFTFTTQVMLGIALTLIGYFSATYIAVFFHHVDAAPIIQALAFLFLLQSFGQTAGALLRRNLNFKAFQTISISSYLTGYLLVGIPSAYYGLGAWSVVLAQLVQSLIFSLLAMWHTKLSMIPAFKPSSHGMFAFGGKVIGANLTSWGISTLDSLVIGRVFGVIDLGIYNRASMLVAVPINAIVTGLQGVLFAASSRAQNDTEKLKKGYLAATAMIALICFPLAFSIAVVPKTIVIAIYGIKWAPAILVIPPLALAMALNGLLAVVGPVLMSQNNVRLELRAQLLTLVVMIPVFSYTAQQSIQAVAWGVVFISCTRLLLLSYAISTKLNTTLIDIMGLMRWPVICAIVVAALTYSVDKLLEGVTPFLGLILDVITAILTMLLLVTFFGKKIFSGEHGNYLLAHGKLPIRLRRMII